ncbi:hypothetical protein Cni_G16232 [Canna indica]|uniref:Uncharacterized protein n=1 Tax=Canna indica TaxID=4628 RepID=A0AAQ3KHF5_9LILI|nr:hypothetical protein Cni_G16232 [Canna indica]
MTCREPYLLRFSPLFVEVSREVAPVALQSWITMFHGMSTGKLKYLDPLYFLMNPSSSYAVEFMAKAGTRRVSGRECDNREMVNHLQGEVGKVLGFECTSLTRRDKYLVLAGNRGGGDSDGGGRGREEERRRKVEDDSGVRKRERERKWISF